MNLDPDWVANQISRIDIANLLIIGIVFWFFYSRLAKKITDSVLEINKKFQSIENKFDQRFNSYENKSDQRFLRIENEIKEIRTSLNRLEGAFMNKDCCMIKDDTQIKKAE